MRVWLLASACMGCSSILGIDDFKLRDGGAPEDMALDAVATCLGPQGFAVCVSPPAMPVAFTAAGSPSQLNTDTSNLCLPSQPASWKALNQPDACFIVGTTITVDLNLTIFGSRPLVLVASDRVRINNLVDVAAHRGSAMRPPGSPSAMCQPGQLPAAICGGAGGTFMFRGGDGGVGMDGSPGGVAAPVGGAPTTLRAGCSGQNSGSAANPSIGGAGGGVLYIVAANRIELASQINASGAGAGGGLNGSLGGAGGGSGGMVLLHAPTITGVGAAGMNVIIANGGGGGAGADGTASGSPGQDPNSGSPTTVSPGGNGPGAPGGAGFAGTTNARPGATAGIQQGAGGGGGGGGYIRSNVVLTNIVSSPAVFVIP